MTIQRSTLPQAIRSAGLATILSMSAFGAALAGAPQPHIQVAAPAKLPLIAYEIDYATANTQQSPSGVTTTDTLASIGLSSKVTARCNIQVAWYDWNGALAGLSGPFALAPNMTLEFTTSVNPANPTQYTPFDMNIFRTPNADGSNVTFEGWAQVLTDNAACSTGKLRVDAEFVSAAINASGVPNQPVYKSINVTKPAGLTGY